MSDKWNKFFEKQALEDLKPPDSNVVEKPETDTEQAGENAEKTINESSDNEGKNDTETKTENDQKGTENHEGSESEETGKETV